MSRYGLPPTPYESFLSGQKLQLENDAARALGFDIRGRDATLQRIDNLLFEQLDLELTEVQLPDGASFRHRPPQILRSKDSRTGFLLFEGSFDGRSVCTRKSLSFSLKSGHLDFWTQQFPVACPCCLPNLLEPAVTQESLCEILDQACYTAGVTKLHFCRTDDRLEPHDESQLFAICRTGPWRIRFEGFDSRTLSPLKERIKFR